MAEHEIERALCVIANAPMHPMELPVSATFIEAYRDVTDKIGPRHRLANRWHFDLRWDFAPGVMAAWLTPEVRRG